MFETKTTGKDLILVKDCETGLEIDCNIEYTVTVIGAIEDESSLNGSLTSESINKLVGDAVNSNFMFARLKVYPDGIEYENITLVDIIRTEALIEPLQETLLEIISQKLKDAGIQVERVVIEKIEIDKAQEEKFRIFRARNSGNYKVSDMTGGPGMTYNPDMAGGPGMAFDPDENNTLNKNNPVFNMYMAVQRNPMSLFNAQMTGQVNGNNQMNTGATSGNVEWACNCGSKNTTKFCPNCGSPR